MIPKLKTIFFLHSSINIPPKNLYCWSFFLLIFLLQCGFGTVMREYHKMDTNKYPNTFGCHIMYQKISEYIQMQHNYRTFILISLYSGKSTNRNTNYIWGSFCSNTRIFVLITDKRNFLKGSLMLPLKKILHWIFFDAWTINFFSLK